MPSTIDLSYCKLRLLPNDWKLEARYKDMTRSQVTSICLQCFIFLASFGMFAFFIGRKNDEWSATNWPTLT
jgi:hypothetical protein